MNPGYDALSDIEEELGRIEQHLRNDFADDMHERKYEAASSPLTGLGEAAFQYAEEEDLSPEEQSRLEAYRRRFEEAVDISDPEERFHESLSIISNAFQDFDIYGFRGASGSGTGFSGRDTGTEPPEEFTGSEEDGTEDTEADETEGYDHGRSLNVGVELYNAGEAVASPENPYEPQYTVSLEAEADNREEAREYMLDALSSSDSLGLGAQNQSSGRNVSDGVYDFPDTEDEVQRLISDELESHASRMRGSSGIYGKYTVEFTALQTDVPLPIEDEGVYRIQAGVLEDEDEGSLYEGAFGTSDWFKVEGAEEKEGLGISVQTLSEGEDLTAATLGDSTGGVVSSFFSQMNTEAEGRYFASIEPENMSEEQYRAAVEEMVGDGISMEAEWGRATDIVEFGDDIYPVLDPSSTVSAEVDIGMDDLEYHDGVGRYIVPPDVFAGGGLTPEMDAGGDWALELYDPREDGFGSDYAAWEGVDSYDRLDVAGGLLSALDWVDRGMPLEQPEEREEEEERHRFSAWDFFKEKGQSKIQALVADMPDHVLGEAVVNRTPLRRFAGTA
ncbi:MAG: hypothetical protein ABEJ83_04550 [Candidatus Nanohaloarchaea archaeon]